MSPQRAQFGTVLSGAGVSAGIVLGNATLIDSEEIQVEHVRLPQAMLESEVGRLKAAIGDAELELDELARRLEQSGIGHGEPTLVLDAHRLMLRDPMIIEKATRYIREERLNAAWALSLALHDIEATFEQMDNAFFRERGADVRHVVELLLKALDGSSTQENRLGRVRPGAMVIATGVSPAETLELCRRRVAALVIDQATPTSHSAIIARSLGVPAVVGVRNVVDHVAENDRLIVDGAEGEVIVHPTQDEELFYDRRARRASVVSRAVRQNRALPAATPDGQAVVGLFANVDLADEVESILEQGAEGVGLFRTEFLFIDRLQLPTEEEQLAAYRALLEAMGDRQVTFRTLDVGGDKILPAPVRGSVSSSEHLRAIRFCLKERGLFRTQLRAMLRASVFGTMRLLVPFVSGLDEVREAKAEVERARQELIAEGHAVAEDVPVGFMIEVPSAALIADLIARECDFLSVGTNDLIQYTIAISRDDPELDYLYHPLHPALLRLLGSITAACRDAGIPSSLCGEMAGEPRYALVLLALGFDQLSMNARSIPFVKEVIRRTSLADAQDLLRQISQLGSAAEVADLVDSTMVERFSEIVVPRMRGAPQYMR